MSNSGGFPVISQRNVSDSFYPMALASIYRSGYRIYDISYALSKDPDALEKIWRDPDIAAALSTRFHMIAGKDYTVEARSEDPRDKLAAQIVNELVQEIPNLTETLYEASQAVLTARSWQYIQGERQVKSIGGTLPLNWWTPGRMKDVDRRRFRQIPERGKNFLTGEPTLNVYWELYSVERDKWERLEDDDLRCFLRHVYADEEQRLGQGRGIMEAIYTYWWIKGKVINEGLAGLEKWARGITIVKVDSLREGSSDRTSDDIRDEMLTAIDKMQSRNKLIMDKADDVEYHETTGAGNALVKDWISILNQGLFRVIVGSVRPFGVVTETGSRAQSETEADTTEFIIQYDRKILEESFTRDVIGMLWRLNRPQLAMLGIADAKMPRFRIQQGKIEDPKANAEFIKTVHDSGLAMPLEWVHKKLDIPMPKAGEAVFAGAVAPSPFGGPGGPAGMDPSNPLSKLLGGAGDGDSKKQDEKPSELPG